MGKHENNDLPLSGISIEIEQRIKEMESIDYVFPERLKIIDWCGFAAFIIICGAVIIGLCIYCSGL